jgi:hypothetical protein
MHDGHEHLVEGGSGRSSSQSATPAFKPVTTVAMYNLHADMHHDLAHMADAM